MIKFLQFLGLVNNVHKLKPFENDRLPLKRYEKDFFAAMLARYTYLINSQIDEDEATEIIFDFIKEQDLDVHNVHQLGLLVRTAMFDPKKDTVH